jgi:hypothetical protein
VTRSLSVVLLLALALSCGAQKKQSSTRSPAYDYPAEGPFGTTTSSGDSIGADRMSLSDKLRSGPTVGSQGVKGPQYPAATEEEEQPAATEGSQGGAAAE